MFHVDGKKFYLAENDVNSAIEVINDCIKILNIFINIKEDKDNNINYLNNIDNMDIKNIIEKLSIKLEDLSTKIEQTKSNIKFQDFSHDYSEIIKQNSEIGTFDSEVMSDDNDISYEERLNGIAERMRDFLNTQNKDLEKSSNIETIEVNDNSSNEENNNFEDSIKKLLEKIKCIFNTKNSDINVNNEPIEVSEIKTKSSKGEDLDQIDLNINKDFLVDSSVEYLSANTKKVDTSVELLSNKNNSTSIATSNNEETKLTIEDKISETEMDIRKTYLTLKLLRMEYADGNLSFTNQQLLGELTDDLNGEGNNEDSDELINLLTKINEMTIDEIKKEIEYLIADIKKYINNKLDFVDKDTLMQEDTVTQILEDQKMIEFVFPKCLFDITDIENKDNPDKYFEDKIWPILNVCGLDHPKKILVSKLAEELNINCNDLITKMKDNSIIINEYDYLEYNDAKYIADKYYNKILSIDLSYDDYCNMVKNGEYYSEMIEFLGKDYASEQNFEIIKKEFADKNGITLNDEIGSRDFNCNDGIKEIINDIFLNGNKFPRDYTYFGTYFKHVMFQWDTGSIYGMFGTVYGSIYVSYAKLFGEDYAKEKVSEIITDEMNNYGEDYLDYIGLLAEQIKLDEIYQGFEMVEFEEVEEEFNKELATYYIAITSGPKDKKAYETYVNNCIEIFNGAMRKKNIDKDIKDLDKEKIKDNVYVDTSFNFYDKCYDAIWNKVCDYKRSLEADLCNLDTMLDGINNSVEYIELLALFSGETPITIEAEEIRDRATQTSNPFNVNAYGSFDYFMEKINVCNLNENTKDYLLNEYLLIKLDEIESLFGVITDVELQEYIDFLWYDAVNKDKYPDNTTLYSQRYYNLKIEEWNNRLGLIKFSEWVNHNFKEYIIYDSDGTFYIKDDATYDELKETFKVAKCGLEHGIDSFFEGLKSSGVDGVKSVDDYKKMYIASFLSENFSYLYEVYTVSSSIGNMVIPLAISALPFVPKGLSGLISSLLMGVSTARNSTEAALQDGAPGWAAWFLGAINGLSETGLQLLVSSVPGSSKLSNAIKESSLSVGTKILLDNCSEGVEEFTQSIISQFFEMVLYSGEPISFEEAFQEAGYGFIVGAILNGGKFVCHVGKITIQYTFDLKALHSDPDGTITNFKKYLKTELDNIYSKVDVQKNKNDYKDMTNDYIGDTVDTLELLNISYTFDYCNEVKLDNLIDSIIESRYMKYENFKLTEDMLNKIKIGLSNYIYNNINKIIYQAEVDGINENDLKDYIDYYFNIIRTAIDKTDSKYFTNLDNIKDCYEEESIRECFNESSVNNLKYYQTQIEVLIKNILAIPIDDNGNNINRTTFSPVYAEILSIPLEAKKYEIEVDYSRIFEYEYINSLMNEINQKIIQTNLPSELNVLIERYDVDINARELESNPSYIEYLECLFTISDSSLENPILPSEGKYYVLDRFVKKYGINAIDTIYNYINSNKKNSIFTDCSGEMEYMKILFDFFTTDDLIYYIYNSMDISTFPSTDEANNIFNELGISSNSQSDFFKNLFPKDSEFINFSTIKDAIIDESLTINIISALNSEQKNIVYEVIAQDLSNSSDLTLKEWVSSNCLELYKIFGSKFAEMQISNNDLEITRDDIVKNWITQNNNNNKGSSSYMLYYLKSLSPKELEIYVKNVSERFERDDFNKDNLQYLSSYLKEKLYFSETKTVSLDELYEYIGDGHYNILSVDCSDVNNITVEYERYYSVDDILSSRVLDWSVLISEYKNYIIKLANVEDFSNINGEIDTLSLGKYDETFIKTIATILEIDTKNNSISNLISKINEEIKVLDDSKDYHLATKQEVNGTVVDFPNEDVFDEKVNMITNVFPQENADGTINYLIGKGVAMELALRGKIEGRTSNGISFSYRTHSDIDLFSVKDTNPNSVGLNKLNYVLGSIPESYSDKTKALKIPNSDLDSTCETVEYNGKKYLIPKLEILFLDLFLRESKVARTEGSDAELLAKQYNLDWDLISYYYNKYYVEPKLEENGVLVSTLEPNDIINNLQQNITTFSCDDIEEYTNGDISQEDLENILKERIVLYKSTGVKEYSYLPDEIGFVKDENGAFVFDENGAFVFDDDTKEAIENNINDIAAQRSKLQEEFDADVTKMEDVVKTFTNSDIDRQEQLIKNNIDDLYNYFKNNYIDVKNLSNESKILIFNTLKNEGYLSSKHSPNDTLFVKYIDLFINPDYCDLKTGNIDIYKIITALGENSIEFYQFFEKYIEIINKNYNFDLQSLRKSINGEYDKILVNNIKETINNFFDDKGYNSVFLNLENYIDIDKKNIKFDSIAEKLSNLTGTSKDTIFNDLTTEFTNGKSLFNNMDSMTNNSIDFMNTVIQYAMVNDILSGKNEIDLDFVKAIVNKDENLNSKEILFNTRLYKDAEILYKYYKINGTYYYNINDLKKADYDAVRKLTIEQYISRVLDNKVLWGTSKDYASWLEETVKNEYEITMPDGWNNLTREEKDAKIEEYKGLYGNILNIKYQEIYDTKLTEATNIANNTVKIIDKLIANGDIKSEYTTDDILRMIEDKVPQSVYLTETYIEKWKSKWNADANGYVEVVVFQNGDLGGSNFAKFGGNIGAPDGMFIMPKSEADEIILKCTKANGTLDTEMLTNELGGVVFGSNVLKITMKVKLSDITLPTGNLSTSYLGDWVPGGLTSGGKTEGIINSISYTNLSQDNFEVIKGDLTYNDYVNYINDVATFNNYINLIKKNNRTSSFSSNKQTLKSQIEEIENSSLGRYIKVINEYNKKYNTNFKTYNDLMNYDSVTAKNLIIEQDLVDFRNKIDKMKDSEKLGYLKSLTPEERGRVVPYLTDAERKFFLPLLKEDLKKLAPKYGLDGNTMIKFYEGHDFVGLVDYIVEKGLFKYDIDKYKNIGLWSGGDLFAEQLFQSGVMTNRHTDAGELFGQLGALMSMTTPNYMPVDNTTPCSSTFWGYMSQKYIEECMMKSDSFKNTGVIDYYSNGSLGPIFVNYELKNVLFVNSDVKSISFKFISQDFNGEYDFSKTIEIKMDLENSDGNRRYEANQNGLSEFLVDLNAQRVANGLKEIKFDFAKNALFYEVSEQFNPITIEAKIKSLGITYDANKLFKSSTYVAEMSAKCDIYIY